MHEAGSRETAVVTRGALTLVIAGQEYRLEDGDSVTFDADLPHHFENPESWEAAFMSVVSAGLRRS
jgi:quercetin dioxygenase-like cupin family protein